MKPISVCDFIMTGKDNAISLTRLSALAGIPERSIRLEVLRERMKGKLILSGDNGYYFPASEEELQEYVKIRSAYLDTARKALLPFKRALKGR